MATSLSVFFTTLVIIFIYTATITQQSQAQPTQNQAPSPASDACNGIFLTYAYTGGRLLSPNVKWDPMHMPYRFESTLTVVNNGIDELKSWRVFVGFENDEVLVSASNAMLADGSSLPAKVGNGTVFAGYPNTDLQTAIATAGDMTKMSVQIQLVGAVVGVGDPDVPLPSNISLVNDGFICPTPTKQGTNEMQVCCTKDSNFNPNTTLGEEFLPRQDGDLTIMYNVIRAYDTNYWAQVTISNHNPLGRLDNWQLSWYWMRNEFIFAMKGAYPGVVDATDCIYGPQGQYYRDLNFSTVLNCLRRPTIIDLPLTNANDTNLGMIPFCCRNGTILPPSMDPSKSTSAFQIHVLKMPPDLNRSKLSPPQNWQISGTLNPDFQCGPPVRVSPSKFPDPSGLPSDSTAVASWQVVCNITQPKGASPRCCVSFSAYYNESIIPCQTCACGCPSDLDELDKAAAPGYQEVYSFNGSVLNGVNNTIFMQGLPGLYYLVAETDGADPAKDPRVPGKQQSVISFTKKNLPGINVPAGDGFPTKVYFNCEECSVPKVLPSSNSRRLGSASITSVLIAIIVMMLIQQ